MDDLTRYFIATSKRLRYLDGKNKESPANTQTSYSYEEINGPPPDSPSGECPMKMKNAEAGKDKSTAEIDNYLSELKKHFDEVKSKPGFLVQAIGAAAAIGVLFVYAFQLGQMIKQTGIEQDTFNAANRPYVGVEVFDVRHYGQRPMQGNPKQMEIFQSPIRTPQTDGMEFRAIIKNFGPVPGTNFSGKWKVLVDDRELPPTLQLPDRPATIFPTQPTMLIAGVKSTDYQNLMNAVTTLKLKVYISYDGPRGHYNECETAQYDRLLNQFLNLGAGCD